MSNRTYTFANLKDTYLFIKKENSDETKIPDIKFKKANTKIENVNKPELAVKKHSMSTYNQAIKKGGSS